LRWPPWPRSRSRSPRLRQPRPDRSRSDLETKSRRRRATTGSHGRRAARSGRARSDLFAQQTGHKAFKVNPKNTQAYPGGIDGTTLVYQLLRGALVHRSDLRLYDLTTRRLQAMPAGINTAQWECCATLSSGWLLFSRGQAYSRDRQLVLLHNLTTGEQRVLDQLQSKNGLLSADQLNGNFAVWARCNPYPRCQIFRYDLASASTTPLPVSAERSSTARR